MQRAVDSDRLIRVHCRLNEMKTRETYFLAFFDMFSMFVSDKRIFYPNTDQYCLVKIAKLSTVPAKLGTNRVLSLSLSHHCHSYLLQTVTTCPLRGLSLLLILDMRQGKHL